MKRFVALGLSLFACGGGTSTNTVGSASVTGTLGGNAFIAADAASGDGSLSGGGTVTAIEITDFAGICAAASADALKHNAREITFYLEDLSSGFSMPTTAPGGFSIYNYNDANSPSNGKVVFGNLTAFDAVCAETTVEFATGGTLTVTAAGGGSLTGTFDATTTDGDHVTGAFSTEACPGIFVGGDHTCQ